MHIKCHKLRQSAQTMVQMLHNSTYAHQMPQIKADRARIVSCNCVADATSLTPHLSSLIICGRSSVIMANNTLSGWPKKPFRWIIKSMTFFRDDLRSAVLTIIPCRCFASFLHGGGPCWGIDAGDECDKIFDVARWRIDANTKAVVIHSDVVQ